MEEMWARCLQSPPHASSGLGKNKIPVWNKQGLLVLECLVPGALLAEAVNRGAISLQGDSAFPFSIFAPGTLSPLVPSAPCSSPGFRSLCTPSPHTAPLRLSQASTVLLLHPDYQLLSHELAACFLLGTNKSLMELFPLLEGFTDGIMSRNQFGI